MEAVIEWGKLTYFISFFLGDQGEDFAGTRTFYNIKRELGMKSGLFWITGVNSYGFLEF